MLSKSNCVLLLCAVIAAVFYFSGCDNCNCCSKKSEDKPAVQTEQKESTPTDASSKKDLVIYFSATGTTKGIAEKIAAAADADLYEIVAAQPYSAADLDWHDPKSRTSLETKDPNSRPEIAGKDVSLDGCKRVFIGYPIWWGEAPKILLTFVESHKFDGITVVPFCTSTSSDLGNSGKILEKQAKSGTWQTGKRFQGNESQDDVQTWVKSLE